MTQVDKNAIARNAASAWCRCFKCDGIINQTHTQCEKEKLITCRQWYNEYRTALLALGDSRLEPSFPSDVDEAAEENAKQISTDWIKTIAIENFKAGAEWMAKQGLIVDAEVRKIANRTWISPMDEKRFQDEVCGMFNADDKVVIQVRKK